MRGEDCKSTCRWALYAGSPPHARGRRGRGLSGDLVIRITPACAGKTCCGSSRAGSIRDHPRMRGEDAFQNWSNVKLTGSPPHARGRRYRRRGRRQGVGITPACAGKTLIRCRSRGRSRDHPPHARGRLHRELPRLGDQRITPACAGKTHWPWSYRGAARDHPRMRGEDQAAKTPRGAEQGSPPHARGRRPERRGDSPRAGITPACAGKTRWIC